MAAGVQVFWVCRQFTLTASFLCLRVTWPFLQAWQHFVLVTFWAPMRAGPSPPPPSRQRQGSGQAEVGLLCPSRPILGIYTSLFVRFRPEYQLPSVLERVELFSSVESGTRGGWGEKVGSFSPFEVLTFLLCQSYPVLLPLSFPYT